MDKKRCNIGVITPYTENFYFGTLLRGIQSAVKEEEGRLFIFNIYMMDTFRPYKKDAQEYYSYSVNHIDGWIILAFGLKEEYYNTIFNTGKPVVFLGRRSEYYNCMRVVDDSYDGGRQATEHLLAHGHNRIAYVGSSNVPDMLERQAGYKEILEKHGCYDEKLVYDVAHAMPNYGKEIAEKMIQEGIDFTAIFAANDSLAMGLIEGLKEANINVPRDIAVVGYDNSESAKKFRPALTSMNQNTFIMGKEAAIAVIKCIKGENVEKEIFVKSDIIVRESCGCLYKTDTLGEDKTIDDMERENTMIDRLEDVLHINSHLGTKFFELSVNEIIKLIPQVIDEYTWFCFGMFKDDKENKNKVVVQTVVNNIKKTMNNNTFECALEDFPPPECMQDYELDENDVIFVVPIMTEKKNMGVMSYVSKIFEETTLFVYDMHMLMYNLIGISIDKDLVMTDLKETLETLKKTQEQLIESEKLISLGSLVSGIADGINRPISEGVNLISQLKDNILMLKELFYEKKLSRAKLNELLKENNEAVNILLANLKEASDLILKFKQIAMDNAIEETRLIKVREYIDDVLLSIDLKSRKRDMDINIECPEDLCLICNPGDLYRVFSNLILNSIIHGYDEGEKGEISIVFKKKEKSLVMEYRDYGMGIKREIFDRIFEPFITTNKESTGLGLGLYMISNTIKKLGGTIECESEYNKGTSFIINLPLSLIAEYL